MLNHYSDQIEDDSTQVEFQNGWTNRVNDFSDKANSLTRNVHCQQ